MQEYYPVLLSGKTVGKVQLRRQGLYYHIFCRCRINGDEIYRLNVVCADKQEKLGVLIPTDGGFGLETRVPVRHLGEGEMEFCLNPKREPAAQGKFIPISPEEPFAYIARLKESFLETRNGAMGIVVRESDPLKIQRAVLRDDL